MRSLSFIYDIKLVIMVWMGMLLDVVNAATASPLSTPLDPWYFGSRINLYIILIDYFKISSVQIYNTPTFSGTKPIDNYQVSLGKVYTNITQHNIIMSSFKCQNNQYFGISLDVQIIDNPTSKVNITVYQLNSTVFSKIGVSVIIVAQPFDKVMTILQYDMSVQYQWYPQSITFPTSYQAYIFVKSMIIRSYTVWAGYFQLLFNTQVITTTPSHFDVKFDTTPDQSLTYNHTIQAVVIFVDTITKNTILQLNFLTFNMKQVYGPAPGTSTIGIDTSIYGTDFNIKCIIGLPKVYTFNYYTPVYIFDLDPALGVTNGLQNSYSDYIQVRSYCFRDLECPSNFTYRKLGDFSNCYDCSDGVPTNINYIPYCNNNSYDSTVSKTSYSITGDITGYCNKCLNCENHYFAQNGTCHLCNVHFQYCYLCDQTTSCLQCLPIALLDNTNACILCQTYINNCLECTSTTICTVCKDGYYLQNSQCKLCSAQIDGCAKCDSPTNCLQCVAPLVPKANNLSQVTCECQNGWRVTSTCTNIYGCISSHTVNNQTRCYACNTTANFMYVRGHNCTCKVGYSFNNITKTCNAQCGDGIYVSSQGCDDDNTDQGDGCDQLCNVQTDFICTNIRHKKSVCRLNLALNATVYSLSRKFGSSQLVLKLSFDPFNNFIQYNSWQTNVMVNSSKISYVSHSFEDNILVLNYAINQSVEYDTVNWELLYDSDKFYSQNQSIPILMKGQNAPLTLESYYNQEFILFIVSYALGGLSLLIGIIAMVKAESNIAFELCTTVLFIFYVRILSYESNPAILYTLGGLRTASGWNDFVLNQHTQYLQYVSKNRFFLKSQLSLGILITLSILIFFLIIKLCLQIKCFIEQISDTKPQQKQAQSLKDQDDRSQFIEYLKLLSLNYEALEKKFITPIVMISMLAVFAAFSVRQLPGYRYDIYLPPLVNNLVVSFFFLIMVYYSGMIGCILGNYYESLQVQQPKKKKNNNQLKFKNYINSYSDLKYMYLIVLAMLILFSFDFKNEKLVFPYMVEICLGIVIIYTIAIILIRPYAEKLNQFAIITNQVIKILFLVFLGLLKRSFLDQLMQLIGVYVFLSFILFIEILSIVRIKKSWITFKTPAQIKKQEKLKKNGIKDPNNVDQSQKKKKYKKDDTQNPYRYENLLKKQNQEEKNMEGFMEDYKKKQLKNKEFNMLQSALQKGNLTSLLLGNNNESQGNSNKKIIGQTNFLDEQINRRQRAQELRKVKQKMRKQTQVQAGPAIFMGGNASDNRRNISNSTSSPEKTWRPLTYEEELEKKYEYDVWREKNLQRAMWQEQQKLKKKMQNKKVYPKKYQ